MFASRFNRPLFGMVHLEPLPGSPLYGASMDAVLDAALADARALLDGGCDGMVFENFGDRPFFKDHVPPETVAAMTWVIAAVTSAVALPFGINVLRNDAASALGIAAALTLSLRREDGARIWRPLAEQGARIGQRRVEHGVHRRRLRRHGLREFRRPAVLQGPRAAGGPSGAAARLAAVRRLERGAHERQILSRLRGSG